MPNLSLVAEMSLEHIAALRDLDNHLSDEEVAEERMDYMDEFGNETMIAEEVS